MSEKIEKYYTAEQLEQLERRKREVGEGRIQEVQSEWPRLIEQVEAKMEAGADPANDRVQQLARRWMELVEEMTGGDQGILRSMNSMFEQEESVGGMSAAHMRELMDYIGKANAASRKSQ